MPATYAPRGGPASKAGIEPGDIIIEFNGKAVKNRDELVAIVTGTRPGAAVPVKVLRDKAEKTLSITVDELNLEEEGNRTAIRETAPEPDEQSSQGFGITVSTLTPDVARRLRVPADTEGVWCPRWSRAARRSAPAPARRRHPAGQPQARPHAAGGQPRPGTGTEGTRGG